ncbi:hypothetical protein HX866_12690 [Pseudomonas gingeri]|uniref:hypothetical protein n=1 Tax=Pseudomonas gingeri TaxID=117681 RepID=UPI0015A387C9|nr:hypothetical protein [Pseudomonas gingeri]NWA25748.1 hypothetical protein [Pseudomonas gingeri]
MMVDFDRAIAVAREQVERLVPGAKDITLEGVLISSDNKLYEVTYSYNLERIPNISRSPKGLTNIDVLANLVGKRREYKVFLVDFQSGQFRGFKRYKED